MARIICKTVKVNLLQNQLIDQIGRDFKSSKHNEIIVRLIERYPKTKQLLKERDSEIESLKNKTIYFQNLIERYQKVIAEINNLTSKDKGDKEEE